MLTVERNQHCVIVYNEDFNTGIAFPTTVNKDVNLYVQELKERSQFIKPGTVLVSLLFDEQYEDNYRPMKIFLENYSIERVLHEDDVAIRLYKFYFSHAIPIISPAGVSYIFCM